MSPFGISPLRRSQDRRMLTVAFTMMFALEATYAVAAPSKRSRSGAKTQAVPAGSAPKAKRSSKPLRSQRVRAKVVDVSGGRAYLELVGTKQRASLGDKVTLGRQSFDVVSVAGTFIAVDLGEQVVKPGAVGVATLTPEADSTEAKKLPTPEPLESFSNRWPEATVPADSQNPSPIPLGKMSDHRRSYAMLALTAASVLPQRDGRAAISNAQLRARVHLEPLKAQPLAIDADLAARGWFSNGELALRRGDAARQPLRIRQLQATYGTDNDWLAAAGRLRAAARLLGALDGARVQARVAPDIDAAAFGGVLPDPLGGGVVGRASRFGAELTWNDLDAELAPSASLVAYGSTFGGELDERRVAGSFDIFGGNLLAGANFEASFYDADNPWGADSAELTQAAAYGSYRLGRVEVGGQLALQRPERSRFIASYLPPGWFCQMTPIGGSTGNEPCQAVETRYSGGLQANYRDEDWSAFLGASAVTSALADSQNLSAFAGAQLQNVAGPLRVGVNGMYASGSFFTTTAGVLAVGAPLLSGTLDVTGRYRPALGRYRADDSSFLEHDIGTDVTAYIGDDISAMASGDYITSRDVNVIVVQGAMIWRPRF